MLDFASQTNNWHCCCCSVPSDEHSDIIPDMQLYIDNHIPSGKTTAWITFAFTTPTHGQPHTTFGGILSISGGWMLLCKEFILAEDSPNITTQYTTFSCSLGVLAGITGVVTQPKPLGTKKTCHPTCLRKNHKSPFSPFLFSYNTN